MELKKQTIEEARTANYLKYAESHTMANTYKRYVAAVGEQDTEGAAEAAREYRNILLEESDSMMMPDRPNVDEQAWRTYRQLLRDISQQDGFPLDITWPVAP